MDFKLSNNIEMFDEISRKEYKINMKEKLAFIYKKA